MALHSFSNGRKKYIKIFGLLVFQYDFFMAKDGFHRASYMKKTYETAKDETALHRALQSLTSQLSSLFGARKKTWEERPSRPSDDIGSSKSFFSFLGGCILYRKRLEFAIHFYAYLNAHKKYLKDIQTAGIR